MTWLAKYVHNTFFGKKIAAFEDAEGYVVVTARQEWISEVARWRGMQARRRPPPPAAARRGAPELPPPPPAAAPQNFPRRPP
jgi:hypothetical protein